MCRALCLALVLAFSWAAPTWAQDNRGIALPSTPANTGRRIALVIGNRAYPRRPLVNSINDARDLGALLQGQLAFRTTVRTDLNQEAMTRAVEDFLGQVQSGDIALFYYAGHGMQIDGENLLLPIDFDATDDIAAKVHAYQANQISGRLRARGARMAIVILDACRDNPFRSWRSESGGGLAGMSGSGAFVAFAADEGKTAEDNPRDRNGLFTKHLLSELRQPGLTIDEIFNGVRANVFQESNGRQTPFVSSGLIGTFRFREGSAPSSTPALDVARYTAVRDSRDPAQLEAAAGSIGLGNLAEILRDRARSLRSPGTASPAPNEVRDNLKDGLKYVFIPAGKFIMGCSRGDTECRSGENPPHAEQIANGFWLGKTEVTQAAWKKVNIGANPSHFPGDQLPVDSVDWNQAGAYCKAIGGRLPTEKEWEYAARRGTTSPRYGDLDAIAWYPANSGRTTHPAGVKQANAFGLYDMLVTSGNGCPTAMMRHRR